MAKILLSLPQKLLDYLNLRSKSTSSTRSEYIRNLIRADVVKTKGVKNNER